MYQWMERRQVRTKVYRYPLISNNVLAYTFVPCNCKETQRFPQTSAQFEISCISGEFHILERRKINVYELTRVGLQPLSQLCQLYKISKIDKIRIPARPCNILYLSRQNPGIHFPYFQLARRSFRFPSRPISQCNFSQLAQILHEERVFCRAAPLGTPENNRRLHIVQKITKNLTTLHNLPNSIHKLQIKPYRENKKSDFYLRNLDFSR